ncbi:MAG: shikimate kinase [Pseudohongiellaceae bacterium]
MRLIRESYANSLTKIQGFYYLMKPLHNIFLIGPMGVGKTTIGRVISEELGMSFFDSDREIEASTGADIPWIFDVEGEAGFRIRESKMIEILTQRKKIVLATGGGAILSPENRRWLSARGTVVYLRASIKQQFERTSRDKNRPLLQTPDPEKRIKELMQVRDPLYREAADLIIDTNRRSPKAVSNEILFQLNNPNAEGEPE